MNWVDSTNLDPKYWEKILEDEWMAFDETWSTDETWENAKKLCKWNCSECIDTYVWESNTRINTILCCPKNPETWEVSEDWFCPNVNTDSWLCGVYQTDEFPEICWNYHCKTHRR